MKHLLIALAVISFSGSFAVAQDYWDPSYSQSSGSSAGGPAEISYGYLDLGYFNTPFDSVEISEADGGYGEISIPIFQSFFIKGGLGIGSGDDLDNISVDYLTWRAGGGVRFPVTNGLHFVVDTGIQYERLENDRLGERVSDYGFYVSPALRFMIGRVAELNGGMTYQRIDARGDFGLDLKALVHFTHRVSAFGGVSFFDEGNQYGVGMRLNF